MYLQAPFSFAETEEEAMEAAFQEWRHVTLGREAQALFGSPAAFDRAMEGFATREGVRERLRISSNPDRHIDWLLGDIDLGFEAIYLHNVHRNQEGFIATFAESGTA